MPIDAPTPIRAERREIYLTQCQAPLNPGVLHGQFGFCDAAIRTRTGGDFRPLERDQMPDTFLRALLWDLESYADQ